MAKKTTKKSAAKTAKPSAPAKKTAAKAPAKKTAVKMQQPVAKKSAAKKTVAKKKTASSSAAAKLVAKVDIGFGNSLFIRGDGPGLSWESGKAMDNLSNDEWVWSGSSPKAFECKLLINDEQWAVGENIEVKPGKKKTVSPTF